MYLKSLELHNFRCFEDLNIDFHENLTVIIGANGTGKSAVMEGVAIALSSMFVKVDGLSALGINRSQARLKAYEIGSTKDVQEQYPVVIKASAVISTANASKEIEWARKLNSSTGQTVYGEASHITALGVEYQKALRDGNTEICLPLIAYYGTGRLWDYHRNKQTDGFEKSNRLSGYIDCVDGTANVKLMMNWFMKMTIQKYLNQEMSLNKKRKVITKYNGEKTVWDSREEAKDFFLEAMMTLENEERDRAECIYIQIMHGLDYCSD